MTVNAVKCFTIQKPLNRRCLLHVSQVKNIFPHFQELAGQHDEQHQNTINAICRFCGTAVEIRFVLADFFST